MRQMMHYHSYYNSFNEEQFAADEYFQQWVLLSDDTVDSFWQSYLDLHESKSSIIFKARELVQGLAADNYKIQPLSYEEKAALKRNIYQRLQLDDIDPFFRPSKKIKYGWLSAAVFFAVLLISAYIVWRPAKDKTEPLLVFTTIVSDKETQEIVLPDSSVVILNAGSSIKYKKNFFDQADREVFLDGNAFFKITKHTAHKQFIVHAKTLDITVLGTQFNVNARTEATDIGLTSGKVKVTRPNATGAAYLLPGEKITLDTVQQELIKSKLDTKLYTAWTDKKWNFQKTELSDIAELISEYYGITTDFKNENQRRLKITAVIPVTTLASLAHILSKTLHIQIQQLDDRLVIQ